MITVRRTHTIRCATQDEGPLIGWFLRTTNYHWLGWDQPLMQTWLVAENDEQPLGCIAANPGIPVGHLDLLCVEPSLPRKLKARVARDLSYAGLEYLKQLGSQVAKFYVEGNDISWLRICTRRGCVPIDKGTILLKRL